MILAARQFYVFGGYTLVLLLSSCALVRLCWSRVADRGNVLDPRSWQMSNVHTASNIIIAYKSNLVVKNLGLFSFFLIHIVC